jgi:hypothetical protein
MKRILFIALIISSINMMAIDGASSINNNEIKIESQWKLCETKVQGW